VRKSSAIPRTSTAQSSRSSRDVQHTFTVSVHRRPRVCWPPLPLRLHQNADHPGDNVPPLRRAPARSAARIAIPLANTRAFSVRCAWANFDPSDISSSPCNRRVRFCFPRLGPRENSVSRAMLKQGIPAPEPGSQGSCQNLHLSRHATIAAVQSCFSLRVSSTAAIPVTHLPLSSSLLNPFLRPVVVGLSIDHSCCSWCSDHTDSLTSRFSRRRMMCHPKFMMLRRLVF